ncbi:hypothetical protein KIL84_007962 [Mauremys mutica]|uniref:Uncharacterized protein n=1 Tax=Mauremys mutica TaxID=74926 RepID=A0A9D3WYF5_9SAUR|nr:hypothetical protein KIL84_007962 [Mauremys mutica]
MNSCHAAEGSLPSALRDKGVEEAPVTEQAVPIAHSQSFAGEESLDLVLESTRDGGLEGPPGKENRERPFEEDGKCLGKLQWERTKALSNSLSSDSDIGLKKSKHHLQAQTAENSSSHDVLRSGGIECDEDKLYMAQTKDVEAQFFTRCANRLQTVTLASYDVAWHIAHAKKPYSEEELIKTCLTDVILILSPENENLQKKMSGLQLSHHTTECRISNLNSGIESQLHLQLQQCQYLSIALDESCHAQDKHYRYLSALCLMTVL